MLAHFRPCKWSPQNVEWECARVFLLVFFFLFFILSNWRSVFFVAFYEPFCFVFFYWIPSSLALSRDRLCVHIHTHTHHFPTKSHIKITIICWLFVFFFMLNLSFNKSIHNASHTEITINSILKKLTGQRKWFPCAHNRNFERKKKHKQTIQFATLLVALLYSHLFINIFLVTYTHRFG